MLIGSGEPLPDSGGALGSPAYKQKIMLIPSRITKNYHNLHKAGHHYQVRGGAMQPLYISVVELSLENYFLYFSAL